MKFSNFKRLTASLLLAVVFSWTMPAHAAITFTTSNANGPYAIGGYSRMATGKMNLGGTYVTGGFTLNPRVFGMKSIQQVIVQAEDGYTFFYNASTGKIMAFQGAAGTPAGTNSTSAVTGTGTGSVTPLGTNGTSSVTAQTFTPASTGGDLNLASPAFSGTGLTAAGQAITTTVNQTMTLNQCAGMWLISATGATPPNLILSNTAVTGAPAVLTVQGSANTDAGAYKIVRVNTAGTNSTSTAAAQTFAGSSSVVTVSSLTATAAAQTFAGSSGGGGAATEVANGTSLASVDQVNYVVIGN